MAINRDEVAHFARLSGLNLAEEELDQFAAQLDQITTELGRVQEVLTDGVPHTTDGLQLIKMFRGNFTEDPPLDPGEDLAVATTTSATKRPGVQDIAVGG